MPLNNSVFVEFTNRKLMTVNSTNSVAFAATDADIANILSSAAEGPFPPESLFVTDTVAASKGRWLDLASGSSTPFTKAPGTPGNKMRSRKRPEIEGGGVVVPQRICFQFCGVGAADTTFKAQIFLGFLNASSDIAAPSVLVARGGLQITATLGLQVTNSGTTNEVWAKTIAVLANSDNYPYDLDGGSVWAAYPGGAMISILNQGARFAYARMTTNGEVGPVTSMNVYVGTD